MRHAIAAETLGFTMDKSCRLYVPFYLLTHPTGGKVPDFSPYGNHGTVFGGAGPWPVPVGNGQELVTNPYFFDGNPPTGWSTANSPESWSGNGWRGTFIDDPASQAYIYQDLPTLENGRKYLLRVASAQTAGNTSDWYIRLSAGGSDLYYNNNLGYYIWDNVIVFDGNGYTGRIEIGNPSASNPLKRTIGIVSIQPLLCYEHRGWAMDGIDDYIVFPNLSALEIQSELTILVWVRFSQIRGTNENWGFAPYPTLVFYDHSVVFYNTLYYNNGVTRSINHNKTQAEKDPRKWQCYAVVYKVGVDMRYYIDSVLKASGGDASAPLSDNVFQIGTIQNGCSLNFRFGEIAVFSRAMSQDEIRNYYLQTRHRYN